MKERILGVMRNVFEDTNIDTSCSPKTCRAWDSMNHLNLVVELEIEFGVSLEPEEIGRMLCYQDVYDIISSKL